MACAYGVVALVGGVFGIFISYAQRAITLDRSGFVSGLTTGLGLLRQQLGTSLRVWMIGLALQIGLLIVILFGLFLGEAGLGLVYVISSALGHAYIGIWTEVMIGSIALSVAFAALNTFMWHYWTVTYIWLGRRQQPESVR